MEIGICGSFSDAVRSVTDRCVGSINLPYLQGQRYWVERSLQEAKQQAGLGDYQVRGWVGWHHHMAMGLMAMLFMLEQRIESGEDLPLTCSDIEWVLNQLLPSRGQTQKEILSLLEKRLRKRGINIHFHPRPTRI